MIFTLKPDENGIVVVLSDVDDSHVQKLEAAMKKGFDPTEEPFSKYYGYDQNVGFYVNKDHFDHAEYKGKRLSFDEYLKLLMPESTSANDSEYDPQFIIKRVLEIKEPKTVQAANAALAMLNFALYKLAEADIDEDLKDVYHKAVDHAFKIQAKAEELLAGSGFDLLVDLNSQLKKYRTISGNLQGKLLQKFNENF